MRGIWRLDILNAALVVGTHPNRVRDLLVLLRCQAIVLLHNEERAPTTPEWLLGDGEHCATPAMVVKRNFTVV
ncbi:hypothetical protein, partial [Teichococcus wenyumeiae]|uniref:hypothetical protein n=1 Tax=Teichococcus wenyumeiae TaxID=2478470 RepID=UPI001F1BA867